MTNAVGKFVYMYLGTPAVGRQPKFGECDPSLLFMPWVGDEKVSGWVFAGWFTTPFVSDSGENDTEEP